MPDLLIAPSILASDFGSLAAEVASVADAGADWIHLDVMDGRFVPNISFGPAVVAAVRAVTRLPLDVHLMIVEPERYVGEFVKAGADIVTVHAEASPHLHRTLSQIRELGAKAGVVLNPHTPVAAVVEALDVADVVLIMSVNPGFGGQSFIPSVLPKLTTLRDELERRGLSDQVRLEIDGGISAKTAGEAALAGADVLVAGSAVFGAAGGGAGASHEQRVAAYRQAIEGIRRAASAHLVSPA